MRIRKGEVTKLLVVILSLCIAVAFLPVKAFATEMDPSMESNSLVESNNSEESSNPIGSGPSINTRVVDNSVDASAIIMELFVILRNGETGEETAPVSIIAFAQENVNVSTFDAEKASAIAKAESTFDEWLQLTRQSSPNEQFVVVGEMAVSGNKESFDNRTYAMRDGAEIGVTGRYMLVEGNYGYRGNYSATMTVEVTEIQDTAAYEFLEGANAKCTQNSDETLTFRANGDFSKFTGVKVDDILIDASNYTVASGSTIVTFKADYLKTLSVGTHKLTVVYNDGECSTNFEIVKAASEQTTPTPTPGNKINTTSPQTGDNSNLVLWFALLFVSGVGMLGTTVYNKKKQY